MLCTYHHRSTARLQHFKVPSPATVDLVDLYALVIFSRKNRPPVCAQSSSAQVGDPINLLLFTSLSVLT